MNSKRFFPTKTSQFWDVLGAFGSPSLSSFGINRLWNKRNPKTRFFRLDWGKLSLKSPSKPKRYFFRFQPSLSTWSTLISSSSLDFPLCSSFPCWWRWQHENEIKILNEKLASTESLLQENPYKKMLEETQERIKELENQKLASMAETRILKEELSELQLASDQKNQSGDEHKSTCDVNTLRIV